MAALNDFLALEINNEVHLPSSLDELQTSKYLPWSAKLEPIIYIYFWNVDNLFILSFEVSLGCYVLGNVAI